MKYVDYREKLGVGFNNQEKFILLKKSPARVLFQSGGI